MPGQAVCAAFGDRDYPYVEISSPTWSINRIAVFSRTQLRRTRLCPAPPEDSVRWLEIDLPEHGFGIGVLHVMAAGSSKTHSPNVAKVGFWDAVLRAAKARLPEPFLFIGDRSTGAHRIDEQGKTFVRSEEFLKLSAMGWTDLWRHPNPVNTEWTWYSTLKGSVRGNGFRLDHAFATLILRPRVRACRYSHKELESGISDHSIVIVEVE